MNPDVVQANYDQLETIASQFGSQAEAQAELYQRVNHLLQALQQGGWEGEGSEAFFAEMNDELFPAMRRLTEALAEARAVTLTVRNIVQTAEEEAARLFQGSAYQMNQVATATDGALSALAASHLAYAGVGGITPFFGSGTTMPLSPWATAPLAAIASVFGPGPVPIFGPGGRVPAGMTDTGKRLWLYFGGKGTDTIFSIHPHAGWGRAPYNLPKPNVRFDYGLLPNKPPGSPNALLPSGQGTRLPHTQNFFHWNQQGAHALYGVRDHQLLTSNPAPQGNVIGRFGGAKLVRGLSRGALVLGAGMDIYSVATAENKVEEGVRRASAWGGAWAGAKGGAAVGAAIGSIFPGPGTAIGGFVGGVGGGIGGYFAGYEVGDEIYDFGRSAVETVSNAGSNIVDSAQELAGDTGDFVSDLFD